MEKKQEKTDHLSNFLNYCKQDDEFIDIKTYPNSVIIYFKNTILTNTFIKLIEIEHNFFVYKSIYIDANSYDECICLFIYKKFTYVFN